MTIAVKMITFPWDDVPHFAPSWAEIAGKAKFYKTAHKRSNGEIIKLCGVSRYCDGLELSEPVFLCRDSIGATHYSTEELCGFVL
jgi:hypothetical protein